MKIVNFLKFLKLDNQSDIKFSASMTSQVLDKATHMQQDVSVTLSVSHYLSRVSSAYILQDDQCFRLLWRVLEVTEIK